MNIRMEVWRKVLKKMKKIVKQKTKPILNFYFSINKFVE